MKSSTRRHHDPFESFKLMIRDLEEHNKVKALLPSDLTYETMTEQYFIVLFVRDEAITKGISDGYATTAIGFEATQIYLYIT